MLKAVTLTTCSIIIFIYLLLLNMIYPYVCWIKHRPSDDDYHLTPPVATMMSKRTNRICPKVFQLNLMPMPMKIVFVNKTKLFRIPAIIRIESKRTLPLTLPRSAPDALFILSIDYSTEMNSNWYPDLTIDESYQLNITSHRHASLYAKTFVGIIRGLSTFEQLQHQEDIPIPLIIADKPRFPWRGLMLDVARHFIPISIIKQTIDYMQLVKMNVLHLHLSDDQGFRLQSKEHPRLHDPHQFYSQSDMQDLIEYARQHAIRIVPEFDMPGHTASWFVGYPHLASVRKDSHQVGKTWGVHNATMDVTRGSTYAFLEKFFSEMTQIFPDEVFHIGGDECVPYQWMESEQIGKFMRENKLTNYQALQAHFTERIEKILKKFNRTMMGWDEISISNLSHKSLIQSWRAKASLIDAARRGYRGILSQGFYLDHMASAEYHYRNDLHVDMILNETEQKRILGGEACLWTEYISAKMVHSRVWPRTAAIAERLWSSHSDQIDCMYDRLTHMNKKFFHPSDEQYIKDLSTLASDPKVLKILADVCEPLGLQGRDQNRNYTSQTPLNRFVDILKPESEQVRQLKQTINLTLLYSVFLSWKRNHFDLHSYDIDILELSENLSRLGDIGIRLLKLFDENQKRPIVSSRWFSYQMYILDTLEYQIPELRLAGVDIVRELLQQIDPCSFDLINLSLILVFPFLIILVQRVGFIRRRLLLPCLNLCYFYSARC